MPQPSLENLLNIANLNKLPQHLYPRINPREIDIGIIHLGVGAFHRAHQAVFTQDAMLFEGSREWGIYGFSQTSDKIPKLLNRQQGLYSLIVKSEETNVRIIGSLQKLAFIRREQERFFQLISNPRVSIITLTVTEKGYRLRKGTNNLDLTDQELIADAENRSINTVIAQLVYGIAERAKHDSGPLTVLCCDNVIKNGEMLSNIVHMFCSLAKSQVPKHLDTWISENVTFPSTMVDRIVPQTKSKDRLQLREFLGVTDQAPVVAEPFSQWLIENHISTRIPKWENVGVEFVNDIEPFQNQKLRLLNGTHSLLAYVGVLDKKKSISQVLEISHYQDLAIAYMKQEASLTLPYLDDNLLSNYIHSVIERFKNIGIEHSCSQVALDGEEKLNQRVVPVIIGCREIGVNPKISCFILAAWLRYKWKCQNETTNLKKHIHSSINNLNQSRHLVEMVIAKDKVFGEELSDSPDIQNQIIGYLDDLEHYKISNVVKNLCQIE